MTEPVELKAGEITQADRNAAAPFVIVPENDRKIRAGEMDWNPLVQAFARHRLAHSAPSRTVTPQMIEAVKGAISAAAGSDLDDDERIELAIAAALSAAPQANSLAVGEE